MPQRFFVTQQARHGDRHMHAQRTRFITRAMLPLYDDILWPALKPLSSELLGLGTNLDLRARMRSMWAKEGSVVGERCSPSEHADIAALVDDLALLARLSDLHLGPASVLGEAARERNGFGLRPVLGDERPLGFPIEVDPPLVAGEDDDEDSRSHSTRTPKAPLYTITPLSPRPGAPSPNMIKTRQALVEKWR
jgi:hypothetical protein